MAKKKRFWDDLLNTKNMTKSITLLSSFIFIDLTTTLDLVYAKTELENDLIGLG